jgi:hypothetical protein
MESMRNWNRKHCAGNIDHEQDVFIFQTIAENIAGRTFAAEIESAAKLHKA